MGQAELLREAVRFVDFLLNRPVAAKVAKVLVFGSVVKGTATLGSDVDILVVTLNGEVVAEQIDEALLDFHGQSAAPVEVVTCALSEILPPRTTSFSMSCDTGRRSTSCLRTKSSGP